MKQKGFQLLTYAFQLPEDIRFYEVDGQRIFPIRHTSRIKRFINRFNPSYICYLLKNHHQKYYCFTYGIEFKESMTLTVAHNKLKDSLVDFRKKLKSETARTVDMDGGDLGREG